jgi:hypothetical protein
MLNEKETFYYIHFIMYNLIIFLDIYLSNIYQVFINIFDKC